MQVQKVHLGSDRYSHIVIGDDYLPIKPILGFIRYLDNTDKSPHTIRAYANHLKLYWDYLTENTFNWEIISLDHLSGFVGWLRTAKANNNVISLSESLERKASTINSILGSLS
jgi:integrase/recombinase XerD